jgi:hypothetical protein
VSTSPAQTAPRPGVRPVVPFRSSHGPAGQVRRCRINMGPIFHLAGRVAGICGYARFGTGDRPAFF